MPAAPAARAVNAHSVKRPYRVFVSAGEVSGDKILGDILRLLRHRFPDMELLGLGGAAAEASGLVPMFPIGRTAFSGAWDVARNAVFALRMHARARSAMVRFRPDLVLLVDYPGLNLRLARHARRCGLAVVFVAPPQAWVYRDPAKKARRAAAYLAGCRIHVLFPFEAPYYAETATRLTKGHFLDPSPPAASDKGALCLCPSSRASVLRRNLPVWLGLLEAAGSLRGKEEVIVLVPEHLAGTARKTVRDRGMGERVQVRSDKAETLVRTGRAIAFPGTVTLELALYGVPTLVLAVLDPLTLALGRRVLGGSRLALPNLLLGRDLFPEWAGAFPGPSLGLFREMETKRDDRNAWSEGLERLEHRIGPGNGAETAFHACLEALGAAG